MRHAATVMLAIVIVVVAGVATAQTTTGRLIGSTVDASGAVLPGVTVTISSPALIGGAQTRDHGRPGRVHVSSASLRANTRSRPIAPGSFPRSEPR